MTARNLQRRLATAEPVGPACPIIALGRQLAELERALEASDRPPPESDTKRQQERQSLENEIWARIHSIDGQLEWSTARSLEGLFLQVAQVGSLLSELAGDDPQLARDDRCRSAFRLLAQVRDGLAMIGDIDPRTVGAQNKIVRDVAFERARSLVA